MLKHIKTGLMIASLSTLLAAGAAVPAYAEISENTVENASKPHKGEVELRILDELTQKIASAAMAGDETAKDSLSALGMLDREQKSELAGILLDEGIIQASQRPDSGVEVVRTGECTSPAAGGGSRAMLRSTYNVTANCDEEFRFAGISVTKVRLTATYVTGSGVVLTTNGATAYVVHSYEPGSSISFSNFSHYVSGGRGYFQTTVTVTRSIFGWNHSTRSANLRLVTNGPGVVSCGWV